MTTPFPMIEKAVKELISTKMPDATGKVGGDLGYDGSTDFYVWLGLIPGGSANRLEGEWVLDVDVFSKSYTAAMERSNSLEALLVGPMHQTSILRIDNCYQNLGPAERPWEDESVFRIGATYVFTARRSG